MTDRPILCETIPTDTARFWILLNELFKAEGANRDAQTFPMILVMAKMGAGKNVVATMLEFGLDGSLDKEHKAYLLGAVMQHRSEWAKDTPPWLFEAVTHDRLKLIQQERKEGKIGWQISPTELVTLIYPATMEAPMTREYADIYLWAGAHANAEHYGVTVDEMWERVGGYKVEDKDITHPHGRYYQDYKQLCQDVRTKIVKSGLEYMRQANREAAPKAQPKQPHSGVQGIQLDLF